jgi:hypothetical protein
MQPARHASISTTAAPRHCVNLDVPMNRPEVGVQAIVLMMRIGWSSRAPIEAICTARTRCPYATHGLTRQIGRVDISDSIGFVCRIKQSRPSPVGEESALQ